MKNYHGLQWTAGIVTAFLGGIFVDQILWQANEANRWEGQMTSTTSMVQEPNEKFSDPDCVCDPEIYSTEPLIHPELRREPPPPSYKYKFPFEDGRRAEAPTGGLLDNARAVYQNISETILNRWGREYEHTLFSNGMVFSDRGKVVEDKMLNAVVQQGGFVAAFTGTSVTAGHDDLYEQSYPIVLNGTLSKLFAAAGVRFEAINVAMGNNPPIPYSYCVDAHAGIDADIISWEMGMEVGGKDCEAGAAVVEVFVRSAMTLPRRPAVLILEADPSNEYCGSKFKRVVRQDHIFIGDCHNGKQSFMSAYSQFGLHAMFMRQLVSRFTCEDDRFGRDNLFRSGKATPHPAKWHPGPHGHELVADALFMHYAQCFLAALERLERTAPGTTAQQLRHETELGKQKLLVSAGVPRPHHVSGNGDDYMGAGRGAGLPSPHSCDGWRLGRGAGNYRCSTTYTPVAARDGSRLLDMVSDRTPVVQLDENEVHGVLVPGHWSVTLNEVSSRIIDYLSEPAPIGVHKPIDRKWVLIGNRESGPIEFDFQTEGVREVGEGGTENLLEGRSIREREAIDDSRVVVCKRDIIEMVELQDTEGVRFKIDGEETSAVEMPVHQYAGKSDCVMLSAQIGVGKHTLSVEPLRVEGPPVAISHVIYPA